MSATIHLNISTYQVIPGVERVSRVEHHTELLEVNMHQGGLLYLISHCSDKVNNVINGKVGKMQ